MVITALGVTVLTGIYAACQDMYNAAGRFYEAQNLFDIRIVSTLGLTGEDVAALRQLAGVQQAVGGYAETVRTDVAGVQKEAEVFVLCPGGLNQPHLVAGRLPQPGEVAVTQAYLDDSGKNIGDTVALTEKKDDAPTEEAAQPQGPRAAATGQNASGFNWDAGFEVEDKEAAPTFAREHFTISAVVLNPMNISNTQLAFRATSGPDYSFFVAQQDARYEVYTAVYLRLGGLEGVNSYSAAYESAVQGVISTIEGEIMHQREQARYNAVMAEALAALTDAESALTKNFAEADEQFEEAWREIEDAKREIVEGEAQLTAEERSALAQLADARTQMEEGWAALHAGEESLKQGQTELEENAEKLATGKQTLAEERAKAAGGFAEAEALFAQKEEELSAAEAQLAPAIQALQQPFGNTWPAAQWDALVAAAAEEALFLLAETPAAPPDGATVASATATQQQALAEALLPLIAVWQPPAENPAAVAQQCIEAAIGLGTAQGSGRALDAQKAAFETQKQAALQQFAAAEAEIAQGEAAIQEGRGQLAAGRAQLAASRQQLTEAQQTLDAEEQEALRQLQNAWQQLADGKQELAQGQAELEGNQREYDTARSEARQSLVQAREKLDEIDMAEWYVQDRTALPSYASLQSDMSSIEAVGNAFPVVFLVVAILISLTTMARMVEEERGLLGTYKALGFGSAAIYAKYLLYAFLACLLGGLLGNFLGFVALPLFLIDILQVMYTLPGVTLGFDWLYGIGGVLLFAAPIVVCTALTCRKELGQTPAALMRPKAPKTGARIFLERLPFVWRRLRFLNKVTARNLFRYKKRLFMTVLGIMGCTALVLAGFAIRDSVTDLMPKQYEQIYRYDLMAVAGSADNEALVQTIQNSGAVANYINLQTGSFKVINAAGTAETVQLFVVPTGAQLQNYIATNNTAGAPVALQNTGVLLTQNAAELLGLGPGSKITLQNLQLDKQQTTVTDVVQNYLGNHVFISQTQYEALFGPYAPNAVLAHTGQVDTAAYAESLLAQDYVLSAVSTQALKDDFATNFTMINSVVYVLILLAAGLAFVVLFTLSSTNIAERVRELATIKVLGFFNNEVHAYVNRETLLLTLLGIALGLPAGRFVSGLLTHALQMPALYFAVRVQPLSYVAAAAISFCFALVVSFVTNRTLNRINMVEALKSTE